MTITEALTERVVLSGLDAHDVPMLASPLNVWNASQAAQGGSK